MRDIPDGWKSGGGLPGVVGSAFDGRWELQQNQDWWGLSLHESDWVCSGCLMVMHEEPPHLLVLRYGDPDAGVGVEFDDRSMTSVGWSIG
jgi:hypothetical protein